MPKKYNSLADSVYVLPVGHLSLSGTDRKTRDTLNKHTTDKLDEDKTNTITNVVNHFDMYTILPHHLFSDNTILMRHIVRKKRDPRIQDPGPFSAKIRKF